MPPAAIQILAFALALLGVLGTGVATLLPNWTVSMGSWSSAVAPVWQARGLWMDCVWYGPGIFSCTMKNSVLLLPPYLQATRAAMVLSCLVGVFGLCLAALGLKCTHWGGSRRAKGHTAVAAGGCFVLASVLGLVPASWFTNEVIAAFLASNSPDNSKFHPGGALCITFISAGFLLAGGVIFCLSCPGERSRRPDLKSEDNGLERRRWKWEQTENKNPERPRVREKKSVQLQTEEPEPEPELRHTKTLQKDVRDSYSLQEYV